MLRAFRIRAEAQGRLAYSVIPAAVAALIAAIGVLATQYDQLDEALGGIGVGGLAVPFVFVFTATTAWVWRTGKLGDTRADHYVGTPRTAAKSTSQQFRVKSSPRATNLARVETGGRPGFVRRHVSPEIEEHLDSEPFTLIAGRAGTGMSRVVQEAILAVAPKAKLYTVISHTEGPSPTKAVLEMQIPLLHYCWRGGVLLLPDLYDAIAGGDVTRADITKFLRAHPRMKVVGLLRTTAAADGNAVEGDRTLERVLATLGSEYEPVVLPPLLTGSELDQVEVIYPDVPEEQRPRLTQYFLDAKSLTDKARRADPLPNAILQVAIDWVRCGCTRPISRTFLRRMLHVHLAARYRDQVPSGFYLALSWLVEPAGSGEALLEPSGFPTAGFLPFELLLEQETRAVKPEMWKAVIEAVDDPAELIRIGAAAREAAPDLNFVLKAWTKAGEVGDDAQRALTARLMKELVADRRPTAGQELVPQALARVSGRARKALTTRSPEPVIHDDSAHGRDDRDEVSVLFDSRPVRAAHRNRASELYRLRMARFVARSAVLAFLDATGIALAYLAVAVVGGMVDGSGPLHQISANGPAFPIYALCVGLPMLTLSGLYRDDAQRGDTVRLATALGATAMITGLAIVLHGESACFSTTAVLAFVVAIGSCDALRHGYDRMSHTWVRSHGFEHRVLFIGPRHAALALAEELAAAWQRPKVFVGYLNDNVHDASPHRLGAPEDLEEVVRDYQVHRVIVTDPRIAPIELLSLRDRLMLTNVLLDTTRTAVEMQAYNQAPEPGRTTSLHRIRTVTLGPGEQAIKRVFDLGGASLALLVLAVPLAVLLMVVWATTGARPIIRSYRPGMGGVLFPMYKIRSHHPRGRRRIIGGRKGDDRWKLGDDTRLGKVLRRFAIDELPQLVNVLQGEMSLVGPRPVTIKNYALMSDFHRRRYFAAPGITGLWQITHRTFERDDVLNEQELNVLVEQDLNYITTWSLRGDVEILLRTIPAVLCLRDR